MSNVYIREAVLDEIMRRGIDPTSHYLRAMINMLYKTLTVSYPTQAFVSDMTKEVRRTARRS